MEALNVGDIVVYKKSDKWISGEISKIHENYYTIDDNNVSRENIRLSVLIECPPSWYRASIIKKEDTQYLIEFYDEICPELKKEQLVDLDRIYVLKYEKEPIRGEKYLIKDGSLWKEETYTGSSYRNYVKEKWIPVIEAEKVEEDVGKTFLDELMSNLSDIPEGTKAKVLNLFKQILSPKNEVVFFKDSDFKINNKSYDDFGDENILDIADMVISYLHSKIKIRKNISYYKSGNNFRIVSNKMDKVIKVTNTNYLNYESDSDISDSDIDVNNMDLSDFTL
jgi:hypothetical protein